MRLLIFIKIVVDMFTGVLDGGASKAESYYFQVLPLFLSVVGKESELPVAGTTYRFSVSKGMGAGIQASRPSTRTNSPSRLTSRWWMGCT